MAKRSRDNTVFDNIGSICEEQVDASLCGIVKSLSPVKRSKNNTAYFHGELADSTGSIRLFGFHTGIHNQLQKHLKLKTPVTLQGCNINMNTTSDNLEIKVLNKTKVQESKRSITVQDVADEVVQIARSKVLPDYNFKQRFLQCLITSKSLQIL